MNHVTFCVHLSVKMGVFLLMRYKCATNLKTGEKKNSQKADK